MATVVRQISNYSDVILDRFGDSLGRGVLNSFLRATMEGPRQRDAARVADSVLTNIDFAEGAALRQLVSWREQSAQISYRQQRDHTAHTLNNYLLGRYIFDETVIGDEIRAYLAVQGQQEPFDGFGSAWPYCSLLHDVGYLFEGSTEPLSTADDSVHVEAALVTFQRFMHPASLLARFGLRSSDARGWASGILGEAVATEADVFQRTVKYLRVAHTATGSRDAFDLWRAWYTEKKPSMVPWVDALQDLFESHALVGHPRLFKRFLNHAVCSGMMLLKALGAFYALGRAQEKHIGELSKHNASLAAEITRAFTPPSGVTYSYDVWSNAILSGTAASALHDLMPEIARLTCVKLKLSDDPLAFLGLLVDELQHWDRFMVHELFRPDSLQSSEVGLGTENKRVILGLPAAHIAPISTTLSRSLDGWQDLVELRPWVPNA